MKLVCKLKVKLKFKLFFKPRTTLDIHISFYNPQKIKLKVKLKFKPFFIFVNILLYLYKPNVGI
ncbi:hypothetical protein BK710_15455 [Bacillus thuringiensis serovar sumiyoshiensis]|nr:hypothetical protein BK710_15455 [Bacillus thuringiensis serovar sumiyoshiensis]